MLHSGHGRHNGRVPVCTIRSRQTNTKTQMKRIIPMLAAGLLAAAVAGCGGKKESDTIIAPKLEKKKPSAPIRMQDYTQTREIEWNGSRLVSEIRRTADDSLAMVTDETGQKFVDNSIELVVRRADGSVFFKKTFTKEAFDQYLDNDYRKTGILEGLVFDRVDESSLRFAASVSHPQTDEYIPLIVTVSKAGKLGIERDTQLDTSSSDEEE